MTLERDERQQGDAHWEHCTREKAISPLHSFLDLAPHCLFWGLSPSFPTLTIVPSVMWTQILSTPILSFSVGEHQLFPCLPALAVVAVLSGHCLNGSWLLSFYSDSHTSVLFCCYIHLGTFSTLDTEYLVIEIVPGKRPFQCLGWV